MNAISNALPPNLDKLGRWCWPDPDCECVRMMRRAGRFRTVLRIWLEQQIEALVDLPEDFLRQAETPAVIQNERMRRFAKRHSVFMLKSISAAPNAIETGLFIQCCVAKVGLALKNYP